VHEWYLRQQEILKLLPPKKDADKPKPEEKK
jgi:hypothetical protein